MLDASLLDRLINQEILGKIQSYRGQQWKWRLDSWFNQVETMMPKEQQRTSSDQIGGRHKNISLKLIESIKHKLRLMSIIMIQMMWIAFLFNRQLCIVTKKNEETKKVLKTLKYCYCWKQGIVDSRFNKNQFIKARRDLEELRGFQIAPIFLRSRERNNRDKALIDRVK